MRVPFLGASSSVPEFMSRACARFFAADWEASSFLEFFVDLKLRVAKDEADGVGRTLARLNDHARFALQITLVRSVDSFVSYLAEIAQYAAQEMRPVLWAGILSDERETKSSGWGGFARGSSEPGVPVEAGLEYAGALAYGNVRQLDRLFEAATEIPLFLDQSELERIGRLSAFRNLIVHGRIFAAEPFARLIDETASVNGLRLEFRTFREDLDLLRVVVKRVDESAATRWHIERPITSQELFEVIGRASGAPYADSRAAAERIE